MVSQIVGCPASVPPKVPFIAGGDFSVSAGDASLRVLAARLRDAFREAGIGWPGTAPSNLPPWRVDQIWMSNHFTPGAVFSGRTRHSDHHIVTCGLTADRSNWKKEPGK